MLRGWGTDSKWSSSCKSLAKADQPTEPFSVFLGTTKLAANHGRASARLSQATTSARKHKKQGSTLGDLI